MEGEGGFTQRQPAVHLQREPARLVLLDAAVLGPPVAGFKDLHPQAAASGRVRRPEEAERALPHVAPGATQLGGELPPLRDGPGLPGRPGEGGSSLGRLRRRALRAGLASTAALSCSRDALSTGFDGRSAPRLTVRASPLSWSASSRKPPW